MRIRCEPIEELVGADEPEDWNEETGGRRYFDNVREELKEMFKADVAVTHSLISTRRIRENLVAVYSVFTSDAIIMWREKCDNCPMRREMKREHVEKIDSEVNLDMDNEGDWWITEFPARMEEVPSCQRYKVSDNLSRVFEVMRCPRYNITVISDVTHTEAAWRRFLSDYKDEVIRFLEIERAMEEWKDKFDVEEMIREGRFTVTLGADVEFEMRDEDGDVVRAASYGYDSTSAKIGCDGYSTLLEIRPGPVKSEVEMVLEIERLLKSLTDEFGVFCGESTEPLGGHVHVAVTLANGVKVDMRRARPYGLVKILDAFLGRPMRKITEEIYTRRIDNGYGAVGNWRTSCHHGIEYRTPPAYWVYSPEMARITMKILRKATELYIKNLGREVRIPDEPSVEDYVKYLGIDRWEAEFFLSECECPNESVMEVDVRDFWGIAPGKLSVVLSDSWNAEVSERLTRMIYDAVDAEETVIRRIVIFGLAKERGDNVFFASDNVAPFIEEAMGWERINAEELQRHLERGDIVIGVPWKFRKNLDEDAMVMLVDAIRRVI